MSITAEKSSRQVQAKLLRVFRKVHRLTGAFLFVFFFFISVSGLFIGWKKHSGDLILAQTRKGVSTIQENWLPISELTTIATTYFQDSVSSTLSPEIDRLDFRPGKGIVKILFVDHHKSLQIDCTTGKVLNVETRWSDLIEQVHDGSIVESMFGWDKGFFKLAYTTIMGLALLLFTVTGFWLWYGPKVMRKQTNKAHA